MPFYITLFIFLLIVTFIPGAWHIMSKATMSFLIFPGRFILFIKDYVIHFFKIAPKSFQPILISSLYILMILVGLIKGEPLEKQITLIKFFATIILIIISGYYTTVILKKIINKLYNPIVITPQYTVSKDLSAAEAYCLLHKKWSSKVTAISLIQLVASGFLTIRPRTTNSSEGMEIKTYALTYTSKTPSTPEEHICLPLFYRNNTLVLDNTYNREMDLFQHRLKDLMSYSIYIPTVEYTLGFGSWLLLFFLGIILLCFDLIHPALRIGFAFIIFSALYAYNYIRKQKQKTISPKIQTLLGLQMFLKTVCKNENMDINTSAIKELLPYAVALDVPDALHNMLKSLKKTDTFFDDLFTPNFIRLVENASEEFIDK